MRHPPRRHHGSRRRLPGLPRHRRRLGPFGVQSGSAADDGADSACHRESARRYHRPPYRTHDSEAIGLPGRHRSHCRCGGASRRSARDQQPGIQARHQRRARAAGATARRQYRGFERQPLARGVWRPQLGHYHGPARVAAGSRCPQYAVVRRIPSAASPESTMTRLKMLTTDDKLAEIRRLYFSTTKQTIQEDLAKALDLLKSMPSEEERERATVYMEGMAQMRADWGRGKRKRKE